MPVLAHPCIRRPITGRAFSGRRCAWSDYAWVLIVMAASWRPGRFGRSAIGACRGPLSRRDGVFSAGSTYPRGDLGPSGRAQCHRPCLVSGRSGQRMVRARVYMDGLGCLPPNVTVLASLPVPPFDRINSSMAWLARRRRRQAKGPWCVSPSYRRSARLLHSRITDLAAGLYRPGIDHPYRGGDHTLPTGRPAAMIERISRQTIRTVLGFMAGRLDVRVADLLFVHRSDRLARASSAARAGAYGPEHVSAIGHSLAERRPSASIVPATRGSSGVNIDGTPWPDGRRPPDVRSCCGERLWPSHHSDRFLKGNAARLANDTAPAYRYDSTGQPLRLHLRTVVLLEPDGFVAVHADLRRARALCTNPAARRSSGHASWRKTPRTHKARRPTRPSSAARLSARPARTLQGAWPPSPADHLDAVPRLQASPGGCVAGA